MAGGADAAIQIGGPWNHRSVSANGTNVEELLQSLRPLHPGDRVRIGDSEFAFEVD